MGVGTSDLIPKEPGFEYMSITLRTTDRIRVIYARDQEINMIREVIRQVWSKGIQEEIVKVGSVHEFKLRGTPFFNGWSTEEGINTKLLVCHLLYRLHNAGWKLITATDLTRTHDFTTWFFQRSSHDFCPTIFGCISMSSWDKLQVCFASYFLYVLHCISSMLDPGRLF